MTPGENRSFRSNAPRPPAAHDGAVDSSGGDKAALKACVEKADGPAPAAQWAAPVQQIDDVSGEEKETARADFSCHDQNHVQQTWFDAEVTLQKRP
ncbi:hypothetical protein [Streptomyces sp. NPDC048516]|uniref:hypothetical protein n=1 Tax=Streptomyces sp. NPDC048516 TaxID=3365565 RepID=UPI00371A071D